MSASDSDNLKKKRLKEILLVYYSREDVRKTMFDFSQNRETIPRYFKGFGKRPDALQYPSDILEQVKKGATSFHCSEEIWEDPLEISTDFSEEDYNEIRTGWDLLLDIDSPYLEYSKIYTDLIIKTLEFHGIKNVGTKFSGNKGFHIIVPWKAFPEEVYGQKTKDMFPEWPRLICQYLTEIVQPKLAEKLFEQGIGEIAKRTGKKQEDLMITECLSCHRPAEKKEFVTWKCPYCKDEIQRIRKSKRVPKCPNETCRKPLIEVTKQDIFVCNYCETNSLKNPQKFAKTREKTEDLIEADLILVAPRHLFRMPNSLHEKTALASIVLDKDKIKDFQILDAKPLKVKPRNFYPDSEPEEAKNLLLQALDWKERKDKEKTEIQSSKPQKKETKKHKKISIPNPSPDIFPPCIKLILKGIKKDGRKRALFILINFFNSLGIPFDELEKRIYKWNKKNKKPLKQGYIMSQLSWHKRQKARLPPNCDKNHYRDLAICKPDALCREIKNPINYAFKTFFRKNGK